MKMTVEMPPVSKCAVSKCAYNVKQGCHARAITVGDESNPGCDTYFATSAHTKAATRVAGVGACKVAECQFNSDFECGAKAIDVGFSGNTIRCLTFAQKAI